MKRNYVGRVWSGGETSRAAKCSNLNEIDRNPLKGGQPWVTRGCLAAPKDRVRAVHPVETETLANLAGRSIRSFRQNLPYGATATRDHSQWLNGDMQGRRVPS